MADTTRVTQGFFEALAPDVERVATRLFAADRAAPRRKRPSDIVQLGVTTVVFGLLAWMASGEPEADRQLTELTDDLPSWLTALAWVGYSGAFLAMVGLLVLMLLRGGIGRGVLRDVTMTTLIVITFAFLAGRLTSGEWPSLLPEIQSDYRETYPTLRTSLVLAGTWVLAPYVTAPVQKVFRWVAVAAIASPVLLSLTTVTHLVGAVALASLAVEVVRLIFGSPEGLPPVDALNDTLRRAGIETEDLAYSPDQPGTVGVATASGPGGGFRYTIKVYGRDVANRQRVERLWRAMWYRNPGPTPGAGRIEQAQNESLALLTCRVSGVNCPELVASGQDVGGDVVVVSIDPSGRPVGDVAPDDVDDELLARLWAALAELQGTARIAHGQIAPHTVWVDEDGEVSFVDFLAATTMPSEQQLASDMAALFTTTAILAGADRAVDSVVTHLDHDALLRLLPYLQEAAIDPDLRREAKKAGIKISALRSALSEELGVDEPELVPIQRVSWSKVIMLVFAVFAANALISQIADVGFDTLAEEFSEASTGWLVVALLIRLAGYSTAYFGLRAIVPKPIPFAPTTFLQSAKSYVGLVVPSMVGRVGLDIRFLQKQGVSTTIAATQGPVISLIGFISEVLLLLLSAWAMGQVVETDGLLDIDVAGILTIAVVFVAVGLAVVFGVRRFREKVVPVIRDAVGAVRSIVTSPVKLLSVFGSETCDRLIGALSLGATVAAFGVDLRFAALIFVSVGTGLLAGLAPVPGGIGVAEATMSALLTAVGVDPALSVSIAIIHRMITSYLPPVLGFFSLNWLTREGYL